MYEILCGTCGVVGFHPSRVGAESQAEGHADKTGHSYRIEPMNDI